MPLNLMNWRSTQQAQVTQRKYVVNATGMYAMPQAYAMPPANAMPQAMSTNGKTTISGTNSTGIDCEMYNGKFAYIFRKPNNSLDITLNINNSRNITIGINDGNLVPSTGFDININNTINVTAYNSSSSNPNISGSFTINGKTFTLDTTTGNTYGPIPADPNGNNTIIFTLNPVPTNTLQMRKIYNITNGQNIINCDTATISGGTNIIMCNNVKVTGGTNTLVNKLKDSPPTLTLPATLNYLNYNEGTYTIPAGTYDFTVVGGGGGSGGGGGGNGGNGAVVTYKNCTFKTATVVQIYVAGGSGGIPTNGTPYFGGGGGGYFSGGGGLTQIVSGTQSSGNFTPDNYLNIIAGGGGGGSGGGNGGNGGGLNGLGGNGTGASGGQGGQTNGQGGDSNSQGDGGGKYVIYNNGFNPQSPNPSDGNPTGSQAQPQFGGGGAGTCNYGLAGTGSGSENTNLQQQYLGGFNGGGCGNSTGGGGGGAGYGGGEGGGGAYAGGGAGSSVVLINGQPTTTNVTYASGPFNYTDSTGKSNTYGAGNILTDDNSMNGFVLITNSSLKTSASTPFPSKFFAPYVDVTSIDTNFITNFTNYINSNASCKFFTLAFMNCDTNGNLTWGVGIPFNNNSNAQSALINSYITNIQKNGNVIVSFGGQNNGDVADYYAGLNPSDPNAVSKVATAYASVIDAYNLQIIDFDIEFGGGYTPTIGAYQLRHQALASLKNQSKYSALQIHLTLQVDWFGGLTPFGLSMLRDAVSQNLKIDVVNLMVMDFGGSGNTPGLSWNIPQPPSKAYPNNTPSYPYYYMPWCSAHASQIVYNQMSTIYNSSTMPSIGLTPMIGLNDNDNSVSPGNGVNMCYQLSDAKELLTYAQTPGAYIKNTLPFHTTASTSPANITRISIWSMNRDNAYTNTTDPCNNPPNHSGNLSTCSYVTQSQWNFTNTFQTFTGSS